MFNNKSLTLDLEEVQFQMDEIQFQMDEVDQKIENFDKEEHFTEEDYKDFLDDCEPLVEVCGLTFFAGDILSKMDPIAFSCSYSDFVDSMKNEEFEEYQELLNQMDELQGQIDDLKEMIEEFDGTYIKVF